MFSGIEFDFAYFPRVIKTERSFKRFTRQSRRERTFGCLVRFMVPFTHGNHKPLLISSGKMQKQCFLKYDYDDCSPIGIKYQKMEFIDRLTSTRVS